MPALLAGTTIEANDMSLAFPASPSTGQIYQGWRFNGSAWDPNYAANFVTSFNGRSGAVALQSGDATSGNRQLLWSQVVTTSVPTVDMFYNFSTAFDRYEIDIYDLQAASGTNNIFAALASWDGSTFDTTTNYTGVILFNASTAVAPAGGAWNTSYIWVGNAPTVNSVAQGNYLMRINSPGRSDRYKYFNTYCWMYADSGSFQELSTGTVASVAGLQPLRGLRFFIAGGINITRGAFKLYGITN
jgi:hypothetical protein